MAAVLASNSCRCRFLEPSNQRRAAEDFSFSGSISSLKFPKLEIPWSDSFASNKLLQIVAEARQAESDRYGTNGRATKMLPTKDLVRSKNAPTQNPPRVNGSKVVNGSEVAVNGASLIKRDRTSALVKTQKIAASKEFELTDELKVLPSDEGFSWANENYNSVQRTVDVWSFVLSLRLRVLFDNAKWAYVDGFTEEKQKIRRRKTASWLREKVLQLGPTFIKLGQLSSTRSDLFPKEFVDELAKLQKYLHI